MEIQRQRMRTEKHRHHVSRNTDVTAVGAVAVVNLRMRQTREVRSRFLLRFDVRAREPRSEDHGKQTVHVTMYRYFSSLSTSKTILWCYLIWYLVTVVNHFDASPAIWLNSAGISAVIGVALLLSVSNSNAGKADRWQTFRLFAMPFCVSSFSSLIKGHGYILIVPPRLSEQVTSIGLCAAFVIFVSALKRLRREARA